MKSKPLSVDLIVTDAETQNRFEIHNEAVEDYAERIEAADDWPFPPLDVFHDGNNYYVADGFHRLLAAAKANRSSAPCRVHKGTSTDAKIFGMTANDNHGLRMSRAEKRGCVEWLLDNTKLNQREVAEKAGVSRRMVAYIVAERKPKNAPTNGGEKVQIAHPPKSANPSTEGAAGSFEGNGVESPPPVSMQHSEVAPPPVEDEPPETPPGPRPLTPKEQAIVNRALCKQLYGKLDRALDDLHNAKPDEFRRDECRKFLRISEEHLW